MTQTNTDIQDKILLTALVDVPFDGWAWHVIEDAAEKAGYSRDMASAVFPNKVQDVLCHFSRWADRQMMAALADVDTQAMRVRDRVREAGVARFKVLEPYKESVRAASTYWLSPFRKLEDAKLVWAAADKIWLWAGDTATDYNHYTKRALLSGVLTTTAVVWLNDRSDNHQQTLAFLDRRIDNVLQVGKFVGRIKNKVDEVRGGAKEKKNV